MMLNVMQHIQFARDESAHRGKTLAEPAHNDVYVVLQSEVCCRTTTIAEHPNTMSVINHDSCAVLLANGYDFGQWRNIAAHAVDAIHNHELTRCIREST